MAAAPNPLPDNGVVGKLTDQQEAALKQFWKELFQLIDNAPRHPPGSANAEDATSAAASDATASSKDRNVPKDDNAKEQQRANEEMQNARLAFEQYGSDRFIQTFWRFVAMDHPDSLCLKFLRARKWNPTAGVAMFASCMKWRIESDVEDIFRKGEEGLQHGEGFLHQMTSGKAYLHGSDRLGRPVFYVHARMHKTSEQSPKALEDFVLFQMESLRCLAHGSIEKVTIIFDLTGFGLANMDWRCLWFIVKCLESYYPESLNVILIHNPPWVFNGIWKIVSPALDPQVRAKVQLTKSTEELHTHIAPSHLAPSLGGQNKWAWKYPSIVPGENRVMEDADERQRLETQRAQMARQFEELTRSWANTSSDSQEQRVQREEVAKRMRAQYFDLDPYIRGRGAYHRLGNIVGNGLVAFHYPGAHELSSGEVEVLGIDGSKETLESALRITRSSSRSIAKPKEHLTEHTSHNDTPAAMAMPADQIAPPSPAPRNEIALSKLAQTSNQTHPPSDPVSGSSVNGAHPDLSRQSSRGSFASGSFASMNGSIPTQKSRKSSKFKRRLTSTGRRMKQFGSMRSLDKKSG